MDCLSGLMEFAVRKSFVPDPYFRITSAGMESLRASRLRAVARSEAEESSPDNATGGTSEPPRACGYAIYRCYGENMSEEKGTAIQYDFRAADETKAQILTTLIFDARKNLNPGNVFEIREKVPPEERLSLEYGRKTISYNDACESHGACWLYLPPDQMQQEPIFNGSLGQGESAEFNAYRLVARLIA